MAGINVTQLKGACVDPSWLKALIEDSDTPSSGFRPTLGSIPVNGSLFHKLADDFCVWLTTPPFERSSVLSSPDELWAALWDNLAKEKVLELLTKPGHGPAAADRFSKALKAYCKQLSDTRSLAVGFKNWKSVLLTQEYLFPTVPISTAHGTVEVKGKPDSIQLVGKSLKVVDYKLSKGANLKTDLLQGVIYLRLLEILKPGLELSLRIEYYEPDLTVVDITRGEALNIFSEIVKPTLDKIAKGRKIRATAPDVTPIELPPAAQEENLGPLIRHGYQSFHINVETIGRIEGPQLIRYHLKPGPGVAFGKIKNNAVNLKILLGLETPPMISAGPGYVNFDVLKKKPDIVSWNDVIQGRELALTSSAMAFVVGLKIDGKPIIADLSDSNSAHVLVAGTNGIGKSEFLKSLVATLLKRNSPQTLKLSLIDPKKVTFGGIPENKFISGPVIFDLKDALPCLRNAVTDMDERYDILMRENTTKLGDRISRGKLDIPFHVIVVDEFADLINSGKEEKKEFETLVKRISAKGRAAGVHLVVATQRPDKDIVSGQLKANLPFRVCLRVTTGINSQIVLDETGGENLCGRGDLLCTADHGIERAQSPFIPQGDFLSLFR